MRVGLDYLPGTTHFPGVGRYARELVRALVQVPDAPSLKLLEWGGERPAIGEPHLGLVGALQRPTRRRIPLPRRAADALFRFTGAGVDRWLGGVDLFHRIFPHWPPVSRAVQLQPVGELPPLDSREGELLRAQLAGLDHFLVFSEHARVALTDGFGFGSARVHRVPIGSDQWRRELAELPPRSDPPVILVLGATRAIRRHGAILRAFEELRRTHPGARLRLLGAEGDATREFEAQLAASPARDAVEWRREPDEAAMPGEMAHASLLVHLTEHEESAVTPLEAMSFGTPVLATRLPAFEEALGDAADLVDNDGAVADPAEFARSMARGLETAGDRAACEAREELARRHTWAVNARATVEVWGAVIGTVPRQMTTDSITRSD